MGGAIRTEDGEADAVYIVGVGTDVVVGRDGHMGGEALLQCEQDGRVAFELSAQLADGGGERVPLSGGAAPELFGRKHEFAFDRRVIAAQSALGRKLAGRGEAAGQVGDQLGDLVLVLGLLAGFRGARDLVGPLDGLGAFFPSRHDAV